MTARPYCIAWMHEPPPEALLDDCPSCRVVTHAPANPRGGTDFHAPSGLPRVCPCECQTCKRAWWADGRPIVRDGEIVRQPGGAAI